MEHAGKYQARRKLQVPRRWAMCPPTNPNTQSGVQVPIPPPFYLLPPPPTPTLSLAHTLWYALKFNQMLNYILTWVPTSWLYSPVSD